ncbi:phage tail fiber protein [Yersinia intermedia]|uniref:phage tail fiber protein n=1 Tax=Yersinia intermedia TaxID=631 RepID=UPI0021BDE525|nr:hypothetical protein [Yersinia intermedia]
MAWYRSGTVTSVAGTNVITGTSTQWNNPIFGIASGQMIFVPGAGQVVIYEILAVDSDTKIRVTKNIASAITNSEYAIVTTVSNSMSDLARRTAVQLALYQGLLEDWQQITTGTGNVSIIAPDGSTVVIPSLAQISQDVSNKVNQQQLTDGLATKVNQQQLSAIGIGLPTQPTIENFDFQTFVFTAGANYIVSSSSWINVPSEISYPTGLIISIKADYVAVGQIGLEIKPSTVSSANFRVWYLRIGGNPGSRTFTAREVRTSANPVPITGGGTGANTAPLARSGLGLGSAAVATLGSSIGNVLPIGTAYNTTTAGVAARYVSSQVPHLSAATSPATQKPSLGITNDNNAAAGAYIGFEREGAFAAYFGLSTSNRLAWGGWSLGGVQYDLITQQNSTVDSNGFLKSASPVVKLYGDGRSKTNSESEGATSERIGEGIYKISGVLGFHSDESWGGPDGGIEIPLDKNKQALIWVDYKVTSDGDLLIKTYHRTHPLSPEFARNIIDGYEDGQPIDIPAGRFIDLRVQMPEVEVTELPLTEM